ncbi:MAG: chloride channel protein [Zetaproteobacteria bacterium]|nr:chloride channel protein [Zetaproteobacteria bacterium]
MKNFRQLIQSIPKTRQEYLSGIRWLRTQDALYLGILSLVIGVLAGYAALFLRYGIAYVSSFWTGTPHWSDSLHQIPGYLFILAPVSGGLIVGLINQHWLHKKQSRVIPGVIEALSERGGRISARQASGEAISSVIAIGSGASMGREAPTVALGAAISSLISQWLNLTEKQMRTLLGCGVAAGIAASFNAPIAGVLFALEVILADYAVATFTPIVLSSVIATTITRSEMGNYALFTVPDFHMVSGWEIPAYMLLGIICGLIATALIRSMPIARKYLAMRCSNLYLRPAFAGLILGCCALIIPEIMSIGYGTLSSILTESIASQILGFTFPIVIFLMILLVVKAATSVICSAGGFGGGMIGPSLFIGATTGALFGVIAHGLFPEISESYGAYALVAAGALLAATIQAPMSTILMVFELSGGYAIMIPLMTASVISSLVKRSFGASSIITESLEERGIDTSWGRERSWMRAVPVSRIPWRSIPSVSHTAKLRELKQSYVSSGKGCVCVVDDEGLMLGIITFDDLKDWLLDASLDEIIIADEVINRHVRTVSENGTLLEVIHIFDQESFEQMPVVSADNPRKVLGILTRNAVFSTYHKLIVKNGESHESKQRDPS